MANGPKPVDTVRWEFTSAGRPSLSVGGSADAVLRIASGSATDFGTPHQVRLDAPQQEQQVLERMAEQFSPFSQFRQSARQEEGANPTPPSDPSLPLTAESAREAGRILWDRYLPADAAASLEKSLKAAAGEKPVRLELVLRTNTVRDLPWELLCDAGGPIAIRPELQVVRTVPVAVPLPPMTVELPLRVFVVATNPKDEAVLVLPRELEAVVGDIQNDKRFAVVVCMEPTLEMVKAGMGREPHVVHYIGHSGVDQGRGNVILHDAGGRTLWLAPDAAAALLPATCRLVCLSTCVTQRNYQIEGLMRMAQAPAAEPLPTIVANQFPISWESARAFWSTFYRELLESDGSIPDAVEAGRSAVSQQSPKAGDWASFALVVRDGTGKPFRFASASQVHPAGMAPSRSPRQSKDLQAQYAAWLANEFATRVEQMGEAAPEELRTALVEERSRAEAIRRQAEGI